MSIRFRIQFSLGFKNNMRMFLELKMLSKFTKTTLLKIETNFLICRFHKSSKNEFCKDSANIFLNKSEDT